MIILLNNESELLHFQKFSFGQRSSNIDPFLVIMRAQDPAGEKPNSPEHFHYEQRTDHIHPSKILRANRNSQ